MMTTPDRQPLLVRDGPLDPALNDQVLFGRQFALELDGRAENRRSFFGRVVGVAHGGLRSGGKGIRTSRVDPTRARADTRYLRHKSGRCSVTLGCHRRPTARIGVIQRIGPEQVRDVDDASHTTSPRDKQLRGGVHE
jgi:hypothetical protein